MIRKIFLLLALSTVVGCGDDGAGPSNIEGRYELRTVNGQPVPFSVTLEGVLATIQSGFIQINGDNSFTAGLTYSVSQGGQSFTSTDTGLGAWVRNNNAIQFNYSDGSAPDVGTISGDDLSMTSEGIALTFRR